MTAQPAGKFFIRAAVREAADRLAGAGVETARLDAECLMAHALGSSREELILIPDRPLETRETEAFEALVARRAAREPVARILGIKEFWSLEFALNAATLVPRPDSETLVAAVLQNCEGKDAPRILDLGTGTGCLLLALLSELPGATGVGVDCDGAALAAARENTRRLGLQARAEFFPGDWFGALEGGGDTPRFDIIVANPPYIESSVIAGLAPEVSAHEPRVALDGGPDGLQAYRNIIAHAGEYLQPGGVIFLELGAGQEKAVSAILANNGFEVNGRYEDLAGVQRVVSARFAP